MKAAIYCRVSTPDQNIESQEKACTEYCRRREIDIFAVYPDKGISGAKDKRPAFNELLADMRSMKFNCIVVTKLDRIGRSVNHLVNLFEEFNNKGVHFIATTQEFDTSTPAGKFMLHMLWAVADFERSLISERTKEGLKYSPNRHKVGKRGPDRQPRQRRKTLRKMIDPVV